jgi:hypothetical protein
MSGGWTVETGKKKKKKKKMTEMTVVTPRFGVGRDSGFWKRPNCSIGTVAAYGILVQDLGYKVSALRCTVCV